ncbi:sensor histidine kinase [Acidobacteria bacterium AB60]|nr:sensor histidine kinase [Acidobacteria bacterium AB60]
MATIADAGRIGTVDEAPRLALTGLLTNTLVGRACLLAVGSTIIGVIFALPMWKTQWTQALPQWWAWGLIVPLMVVADRRLPFTNQQFGHRIAAFVAGDVIFTSFYVWVFFALQAALGRTKWSHLTPQGMFGWEFVDWFLWSSLIYWMIIGALQAYRYYGHYMSSQLHLQKLEKSYSQARLNALRMQLDPHFLFNALNTISSHVERDPRLTRSMIEHLGDLLRMSLETKDRQQVPLAEELAFLDHYLEIQKIRFGDQLEVIIDVAPEVRYASVPSLFLQPLVENAIRHGISRRATGGTVTVSAQRLGDNLAIRVEDDGAGLPHAWSLERSAGLGLSVTRERLAGLYPNENSFIVKRRQEGGTAVEILLPLRVMGEEE